MVARSSILPHLRPLLGCALAFVLVGACTGAGEPGSSDGDRDAATSSADARPDGGGADPGGSDDIYGTVVPRAESYWTAEGRIYFGSTEIRLYGANWFGLETDVRALHGLWTGRSITSILQDVRSIGLTALRVPVSLESIRPGYPSADWANVGEVDTGREQLEALLSAARAEGLYVLLDIHTCDPAVGGGHAASPLACDGYGKEDWLADLRALAELAGEHSNVVGIDLFNEPYGPTWAEWRQLAADGAEAVLTTNPRVLVFVEGVGGASDEGGFPTFWGENLVEAAAQPVPMPAARLVYSPHAYGPGVFAQPYFQAAEFPANMPTIWDAHFGHLAGAGYTLAPGEWGGFYDAAHQGDITWQHAFADYLVARKIRHFFYWAVNPNSGDTGGLYADDSWTTLHTGKVDLLESLIDRLDPL